MIEGSYDDIGAGQDKSALSNLEAELEKKNRGLMLHLPCSLISPIERTMHLGIGF